MSARVPALSDLMVLPGLLATAADEHAAIATLRKQHVSFAVVGSAGLLGVRLSELRCRLRLRPREVAGRRDGQSLDDRSPGPPAAGTYASTRFRVLRLRS